MFNPAAEAMPLPQLQAHQLAQLQATVHRLTVLSMLVLQLQPRREGLRRATCGIPGLVFELDKLCRVG